MIKNAWLMNKFTFLEYLTINYNAVFDILFVSLFAFTISKEVSNSNDKKSNKNIRIQKIPLFKMASSRVKNVRAEKRGSTNWSKMHLFSFQKIDLHFDHWNPGPNRPILRDNRGRNILPVINAIQRCKTFNHQSRKGLYHWCFP